MKLQLRKNLGKYPIRNRTWLISGLIIFIFCSFSSWYCARMVLMAGRGALYAVEGLSLSQIMLTFWLFGLLSGAGIGVILSHFNERLASPRSGTQGS